MLVDIRTSYLLFSIIFCWIGVKYFVVSQDMPETVDNCEGNEKNLEILFHSPRNLSYCSRSIFFHYSIRGNNLENKFVAHNMTSSLHLSINGVNYDLNNISEDSFAFEVGVEDLNAPYYHVNLNFDIGKNKFHNYFMLYGTINVDASWLVLLSDVLSLGSEQQRWSYSLVGFHPKNIPHFLSLKANRFEIFSSNYLLLCNIAVSDRDNIDPLMLSVRKTNNYSLSNLDDIDFQMAKIGFVDFSIVFLDSIMLEFYHSMQCSNASQHPKSPNLCDTNHCSNSNVTGIDEFEWYGLINDSVPGRQWSDFIEFFSRFYRLTRKRIVTIVSPKLRIFLQSQFHHLFAEDSSKPNVSCQFHRIRFDGSISPLLLFDKWEAWLATIDPLYLASLSMPYSQQSSLPPEALPLSTRCTFDLFASTLLPSTSPTQVDQSQAFPQPTSIALDKRFGQSSLRLKNVCLKITEEDQISTRETTGNLVLLLLRNSSNSSSSSSSLVNNPTSIENPLLDLNDLLDEDFGFQFTGFRVQEVSLDSNVMSLLQHPVSFGSFSFGGWIPGNTMYLLPAVSNHIAHEMETLVPIMAQAFWQYYRQTHADSTFIKRSNSFDKKDNSYHPKDSKLSFSSQSMQYPYSHYFHSDRLFMGKTTSVEVWEFLRKLESVIMKFVGVYSQQQPSIQSSPFFFYRDHFFPESSSSSSATVTSSVASSWHSNPLPTLLCFESMTFHGRVNSHHVFFGSKIVGHAWKCYLYWHFLPKSFRDTLFHADHFQRSFAQYCNDYLAPFFSSSSSTPSRPLYFPIPSAYMMTSDPLECPRQHPMKVTWIVKKKHPGSWARQIKNFSGLIRKLKQHFHFVSSNNSQHSVFDGSSLGYLDEEWMNTHIINPEHLSLEEQIAIFAESDIVLSSHGAFQIQAMFMRSGSVWVDLLQGPFWEGVFSPIANDVGVQMFYVIPSLMTSTSTSPSTSTSSSAYDCQDIPTLKNECFQPHWSSWQRSSLNCLGFRDCAIVVDVDRFIDTFIIAYHHVLAEKYSSPLPFL